MVRFAEIEARAIERHGADRVTELLATANPKSSTELASIPDDRWLSSMTKRIFQAGFSWKVIDAKWDGFEYAFDGFGIARWALAPDEDLDALASDTRIVRNPQKIRTVRENAVFLSDLAKEHGTAARFFADYPATDFVGLLEILKKRVSRLGGTTGQYFLRFMGKDSFVLGRDGVAALISAGVVDRSPTSAKAMRAVQEAFNAWGEESGRPLMQISRLLALSTDA